MKLLISIILLITSLSAIGQNITGARVQANSNLLPPLDTVLAPYRVGEIRTKVSGGDTAFFIAVSTSADRKWYNFPKSGGGSSAFISSLLQAGSTNTIDNTTYAQTWQWNTLAGATGLTLSSSSTAAASNLQKVFQVLQTGANGTSTQTTYAGFFSNTKTGTSSTNVGLYATASGGTTNNAIYSVGRIVQEFDGDMVLTGTNANLLKGVSFQNAALLERGFLKANMGTGQVSLGVGAGGFFLTLMENGTENARMTGNKFGWGVTVPTAVMHIKAGTATANTAPIKLNAGTVLTVVESGAVETDAANNIYYSNATARGRLAVGTQLTTSAGTLSVSIDYQNIVFSGTTATWTMPTMAASLAGLHLYYFNKGSGTVTINSSAGGNDFWLAGSVANTYPLTTSQIVHFYCDGTHWVEVP